MNRFFWLSLFWFLSVNAAVSIFALTVLGYHPAKVAMLLGIGSAGGYLLGVTLKRIYCASRREKV